MKLAKTVQRIAFGVWLFCFTIDLLLLYVIVGVRKELFTTTPLGFTITFTIILVVGCGAFLIGVISLALQGVIHTPRTQNIFLKFIKLVGILALFPLYAINKILQPIGTLKKIRSEGIKYLFNEYRKNIVSNTINFVLSLFFAILTIPIWIGGYFIIFAIVSSLLGYNPILISISGTGSMYPTFPKGKEKDRVLQSKEIVGFYDFIPYPNGLSMFGKRYFNHELQRGDIILAQNPLIEEMSKKLYGSPSGFIKRLIGLPGETIEIKNGIVFLNNRPLTEPYTAKAHSTFGETFLQECKKITIPRNKLFIMGDNRKGSGDSREFGFVDIKDIKSVIPVDKQKGKYDKSYRDTSMDFTDSTKIKLDTDKYLELLNTKRKEAGLKELKHQPLLDKSAKERGEVVIQFNDFSFEATKSGTTMETAMYAVGYSNTVWGEAPTQGYYDADELFENQMQDAKQKDFLFNKEFQEVGIAEVEGELNGCPTQVVVEHFAGYIPPNYKKSDIEGWKTILSNLREIQPSWAKLKESSDFYNRNKTDADRVNEIIAIRIANISSIVEKMENNKWLSKQESAYTYSDESLYVQQQDLAKKLNESR